MFLFRYRIHSMVSDFSGVIPPVLLCLFPLSLLFKNPYFFPLLNFKGLAVSSFCFQFLPSPIFSDPATSLSFQKHVFSGCHRKNIGRCDTVGYHSISFLLQSIIRKETHSGLKSKQYLIFKNTST